MDNYRPHMSDERVELLRNWHERAASELNGVPHQRVEYLGLTLDVPEGVFPPSPVSDLLGRAVLTETRQTDRVLDMGTGSGSNALLAAQTSTDVVGVDINPESVRCASSNAALNNLDDRTTFHEGDVFEPISGKFDLIIFDPPFRWFKARNILELAFADENYQTLTHFMSEVRRHLSPNGRILLFFGTSGDLDYLHRLIDGNGFERATVESRDLDKDGTSVTYVTYRLQRRP